MTLYPSGYGTQLVTLDALKAKHAPKMHPEFNRRIWPWIESMGGLIGIGGGWRATNEQPDKPGFAPEGKSFHQSQTFKSGTVAYCALDLVARNGTAAHRPPTWAEGDTAPEFGLHTFITGEPWHIQPIEIRGWQTWVNAGRPDPDPSFQLPGDDDMPTWDDRRLLDTREPGIGGGIIAAGASRSIDVGHPSAVQAIVNLQPGLADGHGFLTASNSGTSKQTYEPGPQFKPIECTVPVTSGRITIKANKAACHLVVDLVGVYVP